ncbi:amidohydrolase [Corynebacterium kutscheri]|uniref:Aminobenzoyl-glutamate utilization protein B n=1 Tax=Corynebacterium kutscheri TaxID=35755 RepID=A0AB38VU94_9CORY|nr:Aminobenzoyl-glutamate utilization protein B [Corynebacterium kutscheri]
MELTVGNTKQVRSHLSLITVYVDRWISEHNDEIIQWRRHLHQHPELSHMEFSTTEFIATTLGQFGLEPVLFPTTGLMVDIGPDTEEKLAFRADIDALPITEHSQEPFSSVTTGVMHACGHDIHTTIALALACALASAPLEIGVRVIFQPAEEVMDGGASEVISFGALQGVFTIYALHAEPKLKVGKIGVRTGAITSASDVIDIKVYGSGGHSSRPHLTQDVVYALAKIVTELPGLLSRRVSAQTATVMVFGSINAGYAANAIPEYGQVSGTIRTGDITVWRTIQPLLEELIAHIIAPTGCRHEVIYTKGVPPVINDDVATGILAEASASIDPHAVVQAPQSSGGEDFSWYLEHVPGSMARLGCWDGSGEPGDLHQANMRADERSIMVGMRLFAAIVDKFQGAG